MLAIYRRELAYFYNSATAYAVITVFVLVCGFFFYNLVLRFHNLSLYAMQNPTAAGSISLTERVIQPMFGNMSIVLLLITPLLTMRLLSDERRMGTAELLFTYPISDWDALLGKYFATLTVFVTMLALTLLYPVLLDKYSAPEYGPVAAGYVGLFLIGAAYIAMGVFFSSLSDNQMVAGVATFGCALLFLLIGWVTPFVSPNVAAIVAQLSFVEHFGSFSRGVIDSNDVVFYLNFAVFFLFLSARVLDSNRWRS